MPIQKLETSRLRKIDSGYDLIARDTVNAIQFPEALAIYVYLATRPQDWTIRKTDLMNRFGLGKDRYARAVRHLTDLGLLERSFIKDAKTGKMTGSTWILHSLAEKSPTYPKTGTSELKSSPTYPISDMPETTDPREIDTLKESESKLKIKEKEGRFSPPAVEEVREYCQRRCNQIDPEAFVAFYESKGWMVGKNKMRSWKSAIITWEKRKNETHSVHDRRARQSENNLRRAKEAAIALGGWDISEDGGDLWPQVAGSIPKREH